MTEATKSRRPGAFTKGDPRTREAARKGGLVTAMQRRQAHGPYELTAIDMMDEAGLVGASWLPWRAFVKAVFALPMTEQEVLVYQRHTDRETPPEEPVAEAWVAVGRGGGKTRVTSLIGDYMGIRFDVGRLAPGELAIIPVIAADRKQARASISYQKAFFEMPEFAPFLERPLKERLELRTGVNVEVHTASFRTVRGFTCPAVICDEVAFWRTDDGSANPDHEVLTALRPAAARAPGSLILGISSPYAARGELFKAHERYYGVDDPHVLVWNADTLSMNPTFPARVIERAFEEDPVSAASEYGSGGRVQFRRDVEAFVDPVAIQAVTATDRRELPPHGGVTYRAFVDPSGGSQDSFTLAIAHDEGLLAVLDAVREVRPPFSPDDVVRDFAGLLRTYRIYEVVGDRYGGEWPRERFRVHGIRYTPSERTKSDIYREFVAPVNAGNVVLLDLPVLRAQLLGLERRTGRGTGRDSIDHGPGARDDVANAVAGALVLGTRVSNVPVVFEVAY